MKKEMLLLFFIIFLSDLALGLGISPAIVDINFAPGAEYEIDYLVYSEDPQQEIEAFLGGELLEYASLSEKKLIGGGNFKVKIKFPDSIEKPGTHRIGVGVKELPSEEEFIGTVVQIHGVIRVNVPYPGRYAEIDLKVPDGNIDENIPVEVYVANKGKESINVNVNVRFFSEKQQVYTMQFTPVSLEPTQDRYFRKFLNTNGFRAGDYVAEAVVNYGDEIRTNKTFRIGSLFVNITNFTDKLPQGGIKKFFIDVESRWNGNLNNVYADVNISNSTKTIGFRTPSVDLEAWGRKTLVGFLDTNSLEGDYKTEILLYYAGEKSLAYGKLNVYKYGLNFVFILALIIAIVIIIIIVIFILFRKKIKVLKTLKRKK